MSSTPVWPSNGYCPRPPQASGRAVRLRDEYVHGIHELVAPDIFTPEIANGLVSAERQGRTKTGESIIFLYDILRAAPVIHPTAPLLPRAMALAIVTRRVHRLISGAALTFLLNAVAESLFGVLCIVSYSLCTLG